MIKKIFTFILIGLAGYSLFAAGNVTFQQGSGGGTVTIQQGTIGGGSGTPSGDNTNVQFNNSGAFGGDSGFQYDRSVSSVTINSNTPLGLFGNPGSAGNSAIQTQFTQMPRNGGVGPQPQDAYLYGKVNLAGSTYGAYGVYASTTSTLDFTAPYAGFSATPRLVSLAVADALGSGGFQVLRDTSSVTNTLKLSTYDCSGRTNSGKLTVGADNIVVCADDISGGGAGGSSSLAVGTGTASNFTTNVTSPTAAISFNGSLFRSVASGTTNFISLDTSTANGLLMVSSAASTYLTISSASATYFPIISSTTLLTASSATATYFNKLSVYVASVNVAGALSITNNGASGSVPTITLSLISLSTGVTGSLPAASIAAGILGPSVIASSISVGSVYPGASQVGTYPNISIPAANVVAGFLGASVVASSFPITGVTAASYTNTNLTVNAQGMITSASNGSAGGGGSSSLAVGTGTASNFTTNVTSPTAAISFLGAQFNSVANGTTNFMTLNQSSVTVEGKLVAGSNITLTPGAGTLTIASSGSGGGSSIYSATSTASFPFGSSFSTITFTGGNVSKVDKYSASAGMCTSVLPCGLPSQFQTSVSSTNYIATTFSYGTTSYWQIGPIPVPENFVAGSTFTAAIVWTSTVTSGNVAWNVQMKCSSDTISMDAAYGTVVSITDGANLNQSLNRSVWSGAITPSGSATAGNSDLYIQLYRGVSATDTMTADARFLRIEITYLINNISSRVP